MKKAVALYRASSRRQGKSGLGLDAQKLNVRNFAAFRKIKIIAEFTEVRSGTKKNRPIIENALKICKETNATLLIANMDRLTRRLLFAALLMESSIKFICVDRPNADYFELHISAAVAEKESRDISRRTREALQAAKARGVKLGTSVRELHRKRRQKYKAFAKRLKPKIKKYQEMGFNSIRAIVKILNDKKVKTFMGNNSKWHLSTVHKLLREINYKKYKT